MKKIGEALLIFDIAFLILGILLSVNVIPIQNIDLLSDSEKRQLLEAYAINYPLGSLLLKIGITLLIPIFLCYAYSYIRRKKLGKRNHY